MGKDEETFTELVYYDKALPFVTKNFPDAVIEDASDFIHEGRFEVTLPIEQRDNFYVKMIIEGYARSCLGFDMMLLMPEKHEEVRRLIRIAKIALQYTETGRFEN